MKHKISSTWKHWGYKALCTCGAWATGVDRAEAISKCDSKCVERESGTIEE